MMNVNQNRSKPSSSATKPIHASVNGHIEDLQQTCGKIERETQFFDKISFYETNAWFDDTKDKADCEKRACEQQAVSYSYYGGATKPNSGRCKLFFGDLRNGIHKISTYGDISHGVYNAGAGGKCKFKEVTTHNAATADKGFFASFAWSEANEEADCIKRCCENEDKFNGGCAGYTFYRPGERSSRSNCKTMAAGMSYAPRRVHGTYTWAIHGKIVDLNKKNTKVKPVPAPVKGQCGYALKKIKFVKENKNNKREEKKGINDACACETACKDANKWYFSKQRKGSGCFCYTGKKTKVIKAVPFKGKKKSRAKVFASVNKKGI